MLKTAYKWFIRVGFIFFFAETIIILISLYIPMKDLIGNWAMFYVLAIPFAVGYGLIRADTDRW